MESEKELQMVYKRVDKQQELKEICRPAKLPNEPQMVFRHTNQHEELQKVYKSIECNFTEENIDNLKTSEIRALSKNEVQNINKRDMNKNKDNKENKIEIVKNKKQFIYNQHGHLCLIINDKILPIANFTVQPEKILIRDDGLNKETVYKLTCILNNGEERKRISLFSAELNSFEWIKRYLGIKYYIFEGNETYKYLEIFISEKFRDIKEEIEYTQVGWRFLKSRWVYLHGGGAIGIEDASIKGAKDKIIEIYPNIDSCTALMQALTLLKISDDFSKTLPLFLFTHLAVMKELFVISGVKPKFALWIYGLTGSMKTSVAQIFLEIFNRGSKNEIAATFKDTITAVEMKSFEYKDSILLVDDFHPTTSSVEKREMERLGSEILRRYGDGISRSRATKNLTKQKEFPPRGLCAITGEDKLGGESTVARYIGIEVSAGDFISEKLLYHQTNPLILSTHIYYFIYWVSQNFELLRNMIVQQFTELRSKTLGRFKHKRFGEAFCIYSIVVNILVQYSINISKLDLEKAEEIKDKWKNVIFGVIKNHEISNIKEDPAIMYLTAIQELITSNNCKLVKRDENISSKSKSMGYFDEEKYYLFPQLAFAEVKEFWRHMGIEFPVSLEQVKKALDQLGVIEIKIESGKRRRTLKISRLGSGRFLVIDMQKMNYILNNIN